MRDYNTACVLRMYGPGTYVCMHCTYVCTMYALKLATKMAHCYQTCAKVPKRFGIQSSQSPRSGILMDLGPCVVIFVERQNPGLKIWITRETQET